MDGEQFALRSGRWKYLEGTTDGTRELYDLQRDPDERRNLVDEQPERADELAARLAAWLEAHRVEGEAESGLEDGDAERLEAMGYVR